MEVYTSLYVGESVRHPKKVLRKLEKGSLLLNAYVITFAAGRDQLEVYDARIFAQKYYRNFDRPIIGIAGNYDEAVELIIKITNESLSERGDCELKEYLLEKVK